MTSLNFIAEAQLGITKAEAGFRPNGSPVTQLLATIRIFWIIYLMTYSTLLTFLQIPTFGEVDLKHVYHLIVVMEESPLKFISKMVNQNPYMSVKPAKTLLLIGKQSFWTKALKGLLLPKLPGYVSLNPVTPCQVKNAGCFCATALNQKRPNIS